MTSAELLALIKRRSHLTPSDITEQPAGVWYTLENRRYLVDVDLRVSELVDGKVVASDHAYYQQGVLRGGAK